VIGAYDDQAVTVWLGGGDGTFTAAPNVPLSGNPSDVRLGAIADGVPDLFVRYYDAVNFDYRVTRWRGVGDGGFQLSMALGPTGPFDLGQFDGDGNLDLAYLATTTMSLRFGNASEQLGMPVASSVPGPARAADLDADGVDDLVALVSGDLTVYLDNGSGLFSAAGSSAVPAPIGGMGFGDVDDDGNLDVVTGAAGGGNTYATVYLGDGAGSLAAGVDKTVTTYTYGVRVQDIDADGIDDALLLGQGTLMFLHSMGDGTLANAVVTAIASCNNVGGFVLDDFNDDCIPDPVVQCRDDSTARVFLSTP
jgi:hypothetical protein